MSLVKKTRKLWHDLYYRFAGKRGVNFALRCRDATEIADLGIGSIGIGGKIRFRLHLSLCDACAQYQQVSKVLGGALRGYAAGRPKLPDIDKVNQDLLKKFSSK